MLFANESNTKASVLGPWFETDIIRDMGILNMMKIPARIFCQKVGGGDARPRNNSPNPIGGEAATSNLSATQNMTKLMATTMRNIFANVFICSNAA